MSNKIQLQTNNTKYASLIETLRGKAAGGSGEDVTDETNAYTTKLASLETAVAALETELEGKASGGTGGSVETCTVTIKWSGLAPAYAFISFMGEDGACVDGILAPSYALTRTINVLKNTMITINNATTNIKSITASDTLLLPEYVMGHPLNSSVPLMLSALNNKSAIFYVTDNSEITIT